MTSTCSWHIRCASYLVLLPGTFKVQRSSPAAWHFQCVSCPSASWHISHLLESTFHSASYPICFIAHSKGFIAPSLCCVFASYQCILMTAFYVQRPLAQTKTIELINFHRLPAGQNAVVSCVSQRILSFNEIYHMLVAFVLVATCCLIPLHPWRRLSTCGLSRSLDHDSAVRAVHWIRHVNQCILLLFAWCI